MVTIREIAERAGVSTATVSNVIHGKSRKVSAETVARIRHLMDEMGYEAQPDPGRLEGRNQGKLVAVIIHYHLWFEESVLSDPFYGVVTGSIEQELRREGYSMMLYASQDIEEIIQTLMKWDVDGVIAVSFSISDCGKLYNLLRKPMISIDAYGKPGEEYLVPDVGLDDEGGGRLMTQHLLELGYETIYVGGAADFGIDHRRWLGVQSLRDSPLVREEKRRLEFLPLGSSLREREKRYREIARQVPFKRKTAIFFTSDTLAMEAMSYLAEWGVRVPLDIGIAGFDNSQEASRFSIPRLTTVRQDFSRKACIAVQELVTSLRDPAYQARCHQLPVSLVSRQSV